MSQYEYYEFQTVDRRLSGVEIQKLRGYSTRAQVSATSFCNEYHFGSFEGDADRWMETVFDGFIYNSHWGTRILMLALPGSILSARSVRPYAAGPAFSIREVSGRVILKFVWHDEDYEAWLQTHEQLSPLLPLRSELAEGDLRGLYLGWLLGVQSGECDAEQPEPPNLSDLSPTQQGVMEFLQLDPDLLAAAAENSPTVATTASANDRQTIAAWVKMLAVYEKERVVVELLLGEPAKVAMQLRARFVESRRTPASPAAGLLRTARELLVRAEARRKKRAAGQARAAEAERKRREELAAEARKRHLASLAGREREIWAKVEQLIATKQSKNYDEAVRQLNDLRDMAGGEPARLDFQRQLAKLRQVHASKRTFLDRLGWAGLTVADEVNLLV